MKKYVLISLCRYEVSNKVFESLLGALTDQGFYAFGIYGSTPGINVFRLDDSLSQIDVERVEQMCREASK